VVETVSVPSHPIRIQIVSELPFPEAAPEYEIGPLRLDARKVSSFYHAQYMVVNKNKYARYGCGCLFLVSN
jgi:hypothetical protein